MNEDNYSPRSSIAFGNDDGDNANAIDDNDHQLAASDLTDNHTKHPEGNMHDLNHYKGFHKSHNFSNVAPLANPIKPKFKKKPSLLGKFIYNRKDADTSVDPNEKRKKSIGSNSEKDLKPPRTLSGSSLSENLHHSHSTGSTNVNTNTTSNPKFKFKLSSLTDVENDDNEKLFNSDPRNSFSSTSDSTSPAKSRNNSKSTSMSTVLDLSLGELDGIVKQFTKKSASISSPWKAPDSWDVKGDLAKPLSAPASHSNASPSPEPFSDLNYQSTNQLTEKSNLPTLYGSKHTSHVVSHDSTHKGKNHIIRVFRQDNTFTTISNSLEATTSELLLSIQKKFFLESIANYQLSICTGNFIKVLEPFERPLKIQMGLLLLSGYKESDNLRMLGSEDLSYICKFVIENSYLRNLTHEEETKLSKDYVHVNISGLNLKNIPIIFHQHTYEIESLNVGNNPAIYVPLDFIQSCNYLKSLTFSRNGCSKFPVNFLEATTLKYLDMEKNFLDELPSNFGVLNNLKHLKLNSNQLNSLPTSFGELVNLETLNLSSNYFHSYPDPISQLINLQDLDLSYNDLSYLPDSLSNLKMLTKLNLCTNKLSKSLPEFFSELSHLKRLDIRYNYINNIDVLGGLANLEAVYASKNYISGFFDKMENFRILYFDRNPITNLDFKNHLVKLTALDISKAKITMLLADFVEKIVNLEKLMLEKNHLVTLPDNLGKLTKLTYLSLYGNNLQSLPASIGDLANLQHLDLHSNNLQVLPESIWNLTSLTLLNVASNILSSFPNPPVVIGKRISSSANFNELADIKEDVSVGENITYSLTDNLSNLSLADNRLNEECFESLSLLTNLKILNLSYNDITEIPSGGLSRFSKLTSLYLSGNELSGFPADDLDTLQKCQLIYVNNNKLVSLPSELSKLSDLQHLDVGSNQLKYNINNWPYDWNWHFNSKLKYLNFSGNKRFEIKQGHVKNPETGEDFDSLLVLKNLKVLGLIDVTLMTSAVPDQSTSMRIRTTASELDNIGYGVSDTMGLRDVVSSCDIFLQKFRGNENEVLFASFDGKRGSGHSGHKISSMCKTLLPKLLSDELDKVSDDDNIPDALRRTFLLLNKEINGIFASKKTNTFVANTSWKTEFQELSLLDDGNAGCSITVLYIKDKKLYTANAGDTESLLSRKNGDHFLLTTRHDPTSRNEFERIRAAGGYVSGDGTLDGDLSISRGAGFFNYLPHTHSAPDISSIEFTNGDDMVIMATKVLWDYISYELAVDIIRLEKDDPMLAAQKLRDFAISYGATDKIAVMVISLGNQKAKQNKTGGLYNNLIGRDNDFNNANFKKKRDRTAVSAGDTTLRMLDDEIEPPVGDLALVFTDIKNSTLLWDTYPVAMRSAIKIHNSIMRRQLRIVGGYEVKTEGDAFMVSFPSPSSALLWCFNVQQQLLTADWPIEILETDQCFEVTDNKGNLIYRGLSVRMGIHWGSPVCELDVVTRRMDYFGPMVNRTSRISALADGGQICISSDFYGEINSLNDLHHQVIAQELSIEEAYQGNLIAGEIIEKELSQLNEVGIKYFELGEKKLKGLETPEHVTLVYPAKLELRFELFQNRVDNLNNVPKTIFGAFPVDAIYGLRTISLKLEMVCCGISGTSIKNEFQTSSSDQLLKTSSSLFKEQDLLGLLNHIVVRVENCVAILGLRQQLSAIKGNNDLEMNVPTLNLVEELNSIIRQFGDVVRQ